MSSKSLGAGICAGISCENAGPTPSAPKPNAPNAVKSKRLQIAKLPLFIAKMGDQHRFAQGCGNVSSPNQSRQAIEFWFKSNHYFAQRAGMRHHARLESGGYRTHTVRLRIKASMAAGIGVPFIAFGQVLHILSVALARNHLATYAFVP